LIVNQKSSLRKPPLLLQKKRKPLKKKKKNLNLLSKRLMDLKSKDKIDQDNPKLKKLLLNNHPLEGEAEDVEAD